MRTILRLVAIIMPWLALVLLASACASPCTPSATLDPMQAWAVAHAHEACILATRYTNGQYINFGVLVPIESLPAYGDAGYRVMPISYCNPAE